MYETADVPTLPAIAEAIEADQLTLAAVLIGFYVDLQIRRLGR